MVFLGVGDVVVATDKFHKGGAVAGFEAVETVPGVVFVGVGPKRAPHVKTGAVIGFAELDGFPGKEVVGHDFAVFSGRSAVGIVESVVVDENNPNAESLALVSSFEEVGDIGWAHVLPHGAMVAFAVGIEGLAFGGLFHEINVFFEGLVGVVVDDLDLVFLGQADVIASFGFHVGQDLFLGLGEIHDEAVGGKHGSSGLVLVVGEKGSGCLKRWVWRDGGRGADVGFVFDENEVVFLGRGLESKQLSLVGLV